MGLKPYTYDHQITLGELIELLKTRDPAQAVRFDFEYMHPDGVHSYRGFYDHLAIGFSEGGEFPTVKGVLAMLEGAVGDGHHDRVRRGVSDG